MGSHGDDIEIECGATILTLTQQRRTLDVDWIMVSGHTERAKEAFGSAKLFLLQAHKANIAFNNSGTAPFRSTKRKSQSIFNNSSKTAHQISSSPITRVTCTRTIGW